MYAPYLPSSASEFPNDNPELHDGARWVCSKPVAPARAVLRASPAVVRARAARSEPRWSPVVPPVRCLPARAAAPAPGEPRLGPLPPEPFALEPGTARAARPVVAATAPAPARAVPASATPFPPGPLQLDLSRIVLPHRVADVPPPPAFIFRPLPSSRRAAAARAIALATPPLLPLGYQVIDQRGASCRVQRRWRVDVAPCLAVEAAPLPEVSERPPLPVATPELILLSAPVPEARPEPPPEQSPASGRRRKPASESPEEGSSKKQRRRAVRVASSASLMTAALPGNAELSRTLSALESDFAERRIEQPGPARKRRGRRGAAASSARARRAANAV